MTYDENGGYGHPDHIQTHRVALAALDGATGPAKVYFTARRPGQRRTDDANCAINCSCRRAGEAGPGPCRRVSRMSEITTTIDTSAVLDRKRAALEAHASQLADTVWVKVGETRFRRAVRPGDLSCGSGTPPGPRFPRSTSSPGCEDRRAPLSRRRRARPAWR